MLTSQKHLFSLDPGITYLNNSYQGPMLKSSEEAAIQDLIKMRSPHLLSLDDFFILRGEFYYGSKESEV